jgi:hypothetical protein
MYKLDVAARMQVRRQLMAATLALLGMGTAQSISAADTQLGVTLGAGRSDNIKRTATNPIDETIASLGVDAAYFQDSKRLYVNILGDLSYLDYLDDTYEREVVGNADAQLNLRQAASSGYLKITLDKFEAIRLCR